MLRTILKSKIQKPRVTESNLEYSGSITIDSDIMDAADIIPNEKVQIVNLNNGARLETYVISGQKGSGIIAMNGGAARHASIGDRLLIMSYVLTETKDSIGHAPKIIFVDEKNKVVDKK
ncbi:MAG: aspartate 1-decarboxylase [Candidatus Omnitrophica bacterium]|nr:aspartate 1-decarboxylase [Candidatus Omnitrophota bacterium]MBU4457732.1 aspartate 1-decarboxylase [Candidatus Omnitrophota bacterium]